MNEDAFDLLPRQDCSSGTVFYACALNSFRGCCTIDPCALIEGCPDDADATSNPRQSTTLQDTTSTPTRTSFTTIRSTRTITRTSTISLSSTSSPTDWVWVSNPVWTSDLSSATDSAGERVVTQTVTVAASTTSTPSASSRAPSSSTPVGAIAGGVIGGIVAIILILLLFLFLRRRKRRANAHQQHNRRSMASLGGFVQPSSPHQSSPQLDSPETPSIWSFFKKDGKSSASPYSSPVSQLDGFPVLPPRPGHVAELADTSAPSELPGDRPAR